MKIHIEKVPEIILKKRKRNEEIKARRVAGEIKSKQRSSGLQKIKFKRIERFIKESRIKKSFQTRFSRELKKDEKFQESRIKYDSKLIIVIRIKSVTPVNNDAKNILEILRLPKVNNAVLLKMNMTTFHLLKLVEPYITWGPLNTHLVSDLIYKRGYKMDKDTRIALTDNKLIEEKLGHLDIICIEDLISEIANIGPNFKLVNAFVWNFHLSTQAIGWKKIDRHFNEGGEYGDRGKKINDLLLKMI